MPALFERTNARTPDIFGFSISVPTRLQTLLIVIYVGLNTVALGARYTLFLENTYWPDDIRAQIERYVSDRSGILAFA